jgi:hypothetical protein
MSKSGFILDLQNQEDLLRDYLLGMKKAKNLKLPSSLLLEEPKYKAAISEMGKNVRGADFEGVLQFISVMLSFICLLTFLQQRY